MVSELDYVCSIMGTLANIDSQMILSSSRQWPLPACRGILYIHFREKGLTTLQIGRMFNRDHATVLAGVKRTKGWLEIKQPYVRSLYEQFNQNYQYQEWIKSEESHL